MNKLLERISNGVVKDNPTFIQMLGMCPTLAVTTSATNGIGMGLTTTAVLVASNFLISALRKLIPNKVRIPSYIVIIATFVTIVEFLLKAYLPSLNASLGIYIPLIVVNCIILGRAESYAAKNPVVLSAFDGIGMGLGFTVGLTAIGAFREILGAGTIFNFKVTPANYEPTLIFILAPGAFFVVAILTALQNKLQLKSATNGSAKSTLSCGGNCGSCGGDTCTTNREKIEASKEIAASKATVAKKTEAQDQKNS
ncbi:electron transport complex subunit E [Mobilitalea sibirica]|uniref:Ion-translocating oxidoreductase complex subunit E n=1 Tax=Mobilitalea sibirica TaxID=1462919 RepID=A0A8J7GZB6_9FIRM|nr:electron transport complex subunit E [Mobilitalea sibirica]MBH1941184.1 electron transport complex subunit E [Mobilitalea sibirica]